MHPTNEPSSLRFNGKYCALFDPPKYKLCGNDKCQKPFGDTVITSDSWSIWWKDGRERKIEKKCLLKFRCVCDFFPLKNWIFQRNIVFFSSSLRYELRAKWSDAEQRAHQWTTDRWIDVDRERRTNSKRDLNAHLMAQKKNYYLSVYIIGIKQPMIVNWTVENEMSNIMISNWLLIAHHISEMTMKTRRKRHKNRSNARERDRVRISLSNIIIIYWIQFNYNKSTLKWIFFGKFDGNVNGA